MKRIIAILLVAIMLLGLTACGPINETEVSVLWASSDASGRDDMETALEKKRIVYAHYDAEGKQETQTQQAKAALDAGCAALVVNLVENSAAQTILNMAKEKSVPVVFFDCEVTNPILSGYESCALVTSNAATITDVQGKQIGEYLLDNWDDVDFNGDGRITYTYLPGEREGSPIAAADIVLRSEKKKPLEMSFASDLLAVVTSTSETGRIAEILITADAATAQQAVEDLQAKGFNKDNSDLILPVFTVGNVANTVADGHLAGTVVKDDAATAKTVATILANLLKGKDIFKGVEYLEGKRALLPYTAQ